MHAKDMRKIDLKEFENPDYIYDLCQESEEPFSVVENNKGKMVIMSIEVYEKLFPLEEIAKEIQMIRNSTV